MKEKKPKAVKEKTFKLDLFGKVLPQLDIGNLHLWETLSEEEQKGFSSYMVSRWMTCTSNAVQRIYVNELVNGLIYSVGVNHPELMMKLLACCGSGKKQFYKWIPQNSEKSKSLSLKIIAEYYEWSEREAKLHLDYLTEDDLVELASELGWETDLIKALKKEFK